jgi:tripartite-type tricarboxylate transporter receptor subunit TctC
VVERLAPDGGEPVGSTPGEFASFIAADMARWSKLVKETGMRFD